MRSETRGLLWIVVLLALLLAVRVACAGDTRTWRWEPSAGADGYRLYIACLGELWTEVADVPSAEWVDDDSCWPSCSPAFLVVTAYNQAGESVTEHGEWAGEGWLP